MDLRLSAATARSAVIWILNCIGVVLLIWATNSHGKSGLPDRDYLFTSEASGGYLEPSSRINSSATATVASSQNVNYTAFDGRSYALTEHRGHYISVLLPQPVGEDSFFTPDHIEELVDRLDVLYVLYRELLHAEPAGSGLLTIAFVPETCGMGCGLIGARGIEILSDPLNYENIIRELDSGRLETVLVHELAHNFDRFSSYLHYLPDHAHAWTDMFEYFAPYRYARNTLNNEAPDDIYNSPVRSVWKGYVTEEAANWETCVRDQACNDSGLTANNLWAMVYYRIESLHGVEALLDSFEFLVDYTARNPPPRTEEEKEGLRILSLAVGVGENIACYMDSLKWPVTQDVRTELQQRFGASGSFCADLDNDGFSAVNGDCDDSDPERNIFATEIAANGRDDDCDELVDEELLLETSYGDDPDNFDTTVQTRLAFEVDGSASDSGDRDKFSFQLTPTGRTRVTLCAGEEFRGWAAALQPDGAFLNAPTWFSYQPAAGCTSNTFDFGEFRQGGLSVIPDESQGAYSLTVSEAADLPPDFSTSIKVVPHASGGVILQVDDRNGDFKSLGADELEFWISGAAVQLFRPFSPQMNIYLSPASIPQLISGKHYQLRVRPRANGLPLAGFSNGHLFRYDSGAVKYPAVDHSYSGAWFDPEHEGEGFIVEVLGAGRALVYWFTYLPDGAQRWMIGMGEVQNNRILIEEMMVSHGGRFGSKFDPDDVTLQTRGSLSLTFLGCSEALANFSIDDNGGHLKLSRLTEIFGHGCGKTDTPPDMDISGSWYDPSHDGEGFIVEQLSAIQALVFWFTYDAFGNQVWLMNTGNITGNRISFSQLLQPTGGIFGRSFDPRTVNRREWGELELQLDCDGGQASYTSLIEAYMPGTQNLLPLTRLENSGCLH